MQAIRILRPGGPEVLEIQEVENPRISAEEILVRVHATAVNRADILQREGRYPAPDGIRNDVPGLEFSGQVKEVGQNVTEWSEGDSVMGLLAGEGYAEEVSVPAALVMPIPDRMSMAEAAAVPEVFLTAYDALYNRLDLKLGDSLLIHAVGSGVGTAALQLAVMAGAYVYGTGSPQKLRAAEELGMSQGINYTEADFAEVIRTATRGKGVEKILDLVGGPYWEQNLKVLASQGRIALVGLLGGSRVEVDLRALLTGRVSVIGTVLRARPLFEKAALVDGFRRLILPLFSQKRVRPIVDREFPWSEVREAHRYMEENKNFGKIVLRVR